MQSSWEERIRPGVAIGAKSVGSYAMHLFHGWARGDLVTVLAIAVPFIATSEEYRSLAGVVGTFATALWGALVYLSGALGPSVISHVAVDVIALSLEWNVLRSYNLRPLLSPELLDTSSCARSFSCFRCRLSLESLRRVALTIQPRAAPRTV